MLAEFLTRLQEMLEEGIEPTILRDPQLPRQAWLASRAGMEKVVLDPPLRNHRINDLQSLLDLTVDGTISPDPEVFMGEAGIGVVCDRRDRREFASMPLGKTERWIRLETLSKSPLAADSKALIRFLRHELAADGLDHVVAAIRRVDFTRSSTGKAHVDHGRESLGKSVEMAVQRAEDIPERFAVLVEPYSNDGCKVVVEVRLSLEIDLEQQRFILRVMPDEITAGIHMAHSELRKRVSGAIGSVPLFGGTF